MARTGGHDVYVFVGRMFMYLVLAMGGEKKNRFSCT